ncbi:uncharacterized protein [Epargyreus clarus]|uniref:uncharacterized protein n=1 Tax=Epargyreus clarus TaxID=520877 RepID=UPI003C2BE49C
MNVINEVTPEMIADTKSLAKYENENIRKDMLEEVTELCKAMRNICDSAEKNNVKDINEAAANFANSSGKLCYVFNPRTNPVKENEILDLSRSACEKASEMLSKVYQLTEAVGGEDGARLDSSGANVVTAAQTLLLAAQITAPSITDARCQSALITTADTVSEQTQDLSYLWEPIIQNSEHQALGDQLEKDREDLEAMLEKLRNACKVDNDEISTKVEAKPSNKERIQFKTTTAAAKRKLDEAEKLLQNSNDTVVISDKANKPSSEHKELQRLTAQKLAELNAAIAALVQATSDPVKPDYITAEMAITTISEVTPDIVQYTNKLSEYTDDKQRRIMLDNVRALCKANKLICDSMDNDDFTELSNAANKFSNTSGKLYYVFNPRANSARENQILELSKAACEKASEMLSIVYELAEEIGGESGSRLDSCGSRVVDSAQALLSVAQVI